MNVETSYVWTVRVDFFKIKKHFPLKESFGKEK
jgi:hypothetical protein